MNTMENIEEVKFQLSRMGGMNERLYIGVPFSHPDINIRLERYRAVTNFSSILVRDGYIVFSPVTHFYPMTLAQSLHGSDIKFWQRLNKTFLAWASVLIVYELDGWEKSVGLQHEIQTAVLSNKPIIRMKGEILHANV